MSIDRGLKMRGMGHPKWKGGISCRPHFTRALIRKKIREIGKCEFCGKKTDLQGHHLNGYANDKDTLQILCIECHSKQHPELENFILSHGRKKILDKIGN